MAGAVQVINVDVDIRTAYNQWTQFEAFPSFMSHVERVEQLDADSVRFHVKIAGRDIQYEAEITEQVPDQRIAWTSRDGRETGGVVTFHYLDTDKTRISLQLGYEPEGLLEQVADLLSVVDVIAKNDLKNFKTFIERREEPTGAWRGEIDKHMMHSPIL